ncbi:hypothetical protein BKP42_68440 [Rhodococcus erythropolis]|nr:hypothetical protein BKP42_68440 [Rhodococcus erythropolis]
MLSTSAMCIPSNSSSVNAMFCRVKLTWKSGEYDCERTGSSTSTKRSNGRSALANAWRSNSRTDSSNSAKRAPGDTTERSARVLTNMPTRSSSARSPRPATGVPTTTSYSPVKRESTTARAACNTMNGVAPCSRATFSNCAFTSGLRWAENMAPRPEASAGRGRSSGRSITDGSASRALRQKSNCRVTSEVDDSSEPNISSCHNA